MFNFIKSLFGCRPPKSAFHKMKCGICLELAIDPMMLGCMHVFCSSCIDVWTSVLIGKHRRCPNCQALIINKRKDPEVTKEIARLEGWLSKSEKKIRLELIQIRKQVAEQQKNKQTIDVLYQVKETLCYLGLDDNFETVEFKHTDRLYQLAFRGLPMKGLTCIDGKKVHRFNVDAKNKLLEAYDSDGRMIFGCDGEENQEEADQFASSEEPKQKYCDVALKHVVQVQMDGSLIESRQSTMIFREVPYNVDPFGRVHFDPVEKRALLYHKNGGQLMAIDGQTSRCHSDEECDLGKRRHL